jgi:HK97 family phage major capsid protein
MNKETLDQIKSMLGETVESVMEAKLAEAVSPMVASQVKSIVDGLKMERAMFGKDKTGLSDEEKSMFVNTVKVAAKIGKTKANEALIEETDNRGGYLVAVEVEKAILRIASSVGLILSQAQMWPMSTDKKGIPNYTGAFLEGEFLGVDAAGVPTGLTFGQAMLDTQKWQLEFFLVNDLIADSDVQLADWLLALAAESIANMVDKQGFIGSGAPFNGILPNASATVFTLGTGKTSFDKFDVVVDAATTIANLEESLLDGAAFYMSRTVWASLRTQKDTSGGFILPQAGAVSAGVLMVNPTGGGVKIAGEIGGFPVFTCRHLPALSASAISTKYIVFGNMKCMAFGDKGSMTVSQFESGAFGGKEIALADQRALVYKKRFALVVALPAGFVVVRTSAS